MKTEILRMDATYLGSFREPAFAFLPNWPQLYETIFRRLSPWARPDEIRLEGGKQPSEFLVVCTLFQIGVAVRFRLTEVEAWTNNRDVLRTPSLWQELIQAATAINSDMRQGSGYSLHTFAISAHFRLVETTLDRQIGVWASSTLRGFGLSGASFVSTGEGPTVRLELQPSLVHLGAENGFSRLTCEVPGETPVNDASTLAQRTILTTLDQIGLDLGIA